MWIKYMYYKHTLSLTHLLTSSSIYLLFVKGQRNKKNKKKIKMMINLVLESVLSDCCCFNHNTTAIYIFPNGWWRYTANTIYLICNVALHCIAFICIMLVVVDDICWSYYFNFAFNFSITKSRTKSCNFPC